MPTASNQSSAFGRHQCAGVIHTTIAPMMQMMSGILSFIQNTGAPINTSRTVPPPTPVTTAKVNNDGLNMRQGPGASYARIVTLANDAALHGLGAAPIHFAYPYGEVSPRAKALLAGRYASLRGVHKGLVHDGGDRNQLPGVGIEGPDGEATARAWIDRAVAEQAWLILYTHDVRETPSAWGCTPDALERLIAHARDAGCDIRTVGEVLAA